MPVSLNEVNCYWTHLTELAQLQTDLDVLLPIQYCLCIDPYAYAVNYLFDHGICTQQFLLVIEYFLSPKMLNIT